jgi:hypothetical protein
VSGGTFSSEDYVDHLANIHPSWSYDSHKLAFVKNGDVFTVEENGASLFNRTSSLSTFDMEPTWSPNENLLAFIRRIEPKSELVILNDNTESIAPLPVSSEINGFANIVWSIDGQQLAFSGSYTEIKVEEGINIFGEKVTYVVRNVLGDGLFVMNSDATGLLKISNTPWPVKGWYGGN